MPADYIDRWRAELTTQRNAIDLEATPEEFPRQMGLTLLVNRLDLMLKRLDDERLHATFPDLVADHVRLNGKLRVTRRAVTQRSR